MNGGDQNRRQRRGPQVANSPAMSAAPTVVGASPAGPSSVLAYLAEVDNGGELPKCLQPGGTPAARMMAMAAKQQAAHRRNGTAVAAEPAATALRPRRVLPAGDGSAAVTVPSGEGVLVNGVPASMAMPVHGAAAAAAGGALANSVPGEAVGRSWMHALADSDIDLQSLLTVVSAQGNQLYQLASQVLHKNKTGTASASGSAGGAAPETRSASRAAAAVHAKAAARKA